MSCWYKWTVSHIYRPQRSWDKVMFLQASVILSTGGVCLSVCWDTTTPPEQTPPWTTPPQSRHPPFEQTPPWSRHPQRPTPPDQTPPPPGKQTPGYGQRAAGTHPTWMHSCVVIDLHQLHIKVLNDGFRSATRLFLFKFQSISDILKIKFSCSPDYIKYQFNFEL